MGLKLLLSGNPSPWTGNRINDQFLSAGEWYTNPGTSIAGPITVVAGHTYSWRGGERSRTRWETSGGSFLGYLDQNVAITDIITAVAPANAAKLYVYFGSSSFTFEFTEGTEFIPLSYAESGAAIYGPYALAAIVDYFASVITLAAGVPDGATVGLYKALTDDETAPASWDLVELLQSDTLAIGGTASADSVYSTDAAVKAFDGIPATFWRSTTDTAYHWIKYDLGVGNAATVRRLRVWSTNPGMGVFDGWTLQGSNDDSTWTDIMTGGSLDCYAQVQDFTVDNETAYRYYRFYLTGTAAGDNRALISGLNLFSVALPTAFEIPGLSAHDDLSAKYLWIKVALTGDGDIITPEITALSYAVENTANPNAINLQLDPADRMKYPQGLVSVDFAGQIKGAADAVVEPFLLTLTPTGIVKVFSPNDMERFTLSAAIAAVRSRVYYKNFYVDDEPAFTLSSTIDVVRTNVNDL